MDLALVQVASDVDLAEVDDRGVRLDRNDFTDAAHFHGDVDDGGGAGGDRNPRLLLFLEAGELRGDLVGAEREQRRAIEPVGIRDDHALGAGVGVVDGDRDAGQQPARCILDRAFNRAVDGLGLRVRAAGGQRQRSDERERRPNPPTYSCGHRISS